MTSGTEQDPRPDEPDDGYPDFLWPGEDGPDEDGRDDDGPEEQGRPAPVRAAVPPAVPVPAPWGMPPGAAAAPEASERGRRVLALAITAVVAVGLGAMLIYQSRQAGATPAAAASPGTGQAPGQGGGLARPGRGQAGPGTATELQLLARVTAVRPGTITLGGPVPSVTASVTSGTRFTGSVRTLSGVRVGDTVAARISIVNGVAQAVTLRDPASEP